MGGLENGAASYSLTRCRHFFHPRANTALRWSLPPSAQGREKGRGKKNRRDGGGSSDFAGTGSVWKMATSALIARSGWKMDWESLADMT
jgi:hypothetical protein